MKNFMFTLVLSLVSIGCMLVHGPSQTFAKAPAGFTALFNGKDLSGWKGLVADPKKRAAMPPAKLAAEQKKADRQMRDHWKVIDGALEYDGKGNSLCSLKDYGDFELYVDWKILERGDSGIYLRGSPQLQIWDTDFKGYHQIGADKGSGALWNNKDNPRFPSKKADKPVGQWNTFYIKMVGQRVTVKLNGELIVDNIVMENYWEPDKPIYQRGQIELQHHGNKLWFRNIYIRELDSTGSKQAAISPKDKPIKLFNGKNLDGFYTYIRGDGYDDPRRVFTAQDGILRVSGDGWGGLITKKSYRDYHVICDGGHLLYKVNGVVVNEAFDANPDEGKILLQTELAELFVRRYELWPLGKAPE